MLGADNPRAYPKARALEGATVLFGTQQGARLPGTPCATQKTADFGNMEIGRIGPIRPILGSALCELHGVPERPLSGEQRQPYSQRLSRVVGSPGACSAPFSRRSRAGHGSDSPATSRQHPTGHAAGSVSSRCAERRGAGAVSLQSSCTPPRLCPPG